MVRYRANLEVVSAMIAAAIFVLAVIELWRREKWKGEMAG